ncbi:porin [Aliidiomarina soli]|uniref:Porin n=1 Tax=Aliidiomarina soli TaxID=1928574 RepID=A0A432WE47_9GAMM|nr:porin [Aliidiomarina soli]
MSNCHFSVTKCNYSISPATPYSNFAGDNTVKLNPIFAACAVTLGLASAMPAQATDIEVYGRAHISTDILGDGSDYGLNVSSNSSRLGFRAKHQVAPGLEAFVQLEQNVRFDQRGGDFATRDSFAGLRGSWGQMRWGSFDTPGKILRADADVFNDRLGDLRNVAQGPGMNYDQTTGLNSDPNYDQRFRNSLHYRSPSFNNITFDLQYSPHNQTDATTENDFEAISVALNYEANGLWLAGSYEMTEGAELDPSAMRLAASYWFTEQWQGITFYQKSSDMLFGDRDVFGGGFKYLFGDYGLMGQAYQASGNDLDDTSATLVALGLDYYMHEDFTLYAILGLTDNDDQANFLVSGGGRDVKLTPAVGNQATGLSLGFIYNF